MELLKLWMFSIAVDFEDLATKAGPKLVHHPPSNRGSMKPVPRPLESVDSTPRARGEPSQYACRKKSLKSFLSTKDLSDR